MKPAGADRVRELNEDMAGNIREGSPKRESPRASFIDHDGAFPIGQNNLSQSNQTAVRHGVANDGERFLSDRLTWGDIIRSVVVARVDLFARDKAVQLDRLVVFDPRARESKVSRVRLANLLGHCRIARPIRISDTNMARLSRVLQIAGHGGR